MHPLGPGTLALLALALAGCLGPTAEPPSLPGCDQTTDFAFVGETTLAALGLPDFAGGQDAVRTGKIWVTARPVSVDRGPVQPNDEPGMELLSRMVCVEWPDGSGMAGSIDEGWQPPPGLLATPSGSGSAVPILALVVVTTVVIGVSFIAFRRDSRREPGEG